MSSFTQTMRTGLLVAIALLTGCASYTVPGGPAPLGALGATKADQAINTAPSLLKYYNAKPLATFPAMIAVARVQSSGYQSRTAEGYGIGAYTVITTRDVEDDASMAKLNALPKVQAVAPISRLLLPQTTRDEDDLRAAAARVKADMLLIYTFDTKFYTKDFAAPVTLITLGLSPNHRAYVTTTCSAILMDVRSGYIYGGAEATEKSDQIANGWTTDDAVDDTRLRTERASFKKMTAELEGEWTRILATYAKESSTTVPTN
ncbi:MAG: hypothetical protein QM770_23930 [Tepidisphaeraceae bacterium]